MSAERASLPTARGRPARDGVAPRSVGLALALVLLPVPSFAAEGFGWKAGASWRLIDAMRAKSGLPRREFWITPDTW